MKQIPLLLFVCIALAAGPWLSAAEPDPTAAEAMAAKIILPEVEVKEMTVVEAVRYLVNMSRRNPDEKGIYMLVKTLPPKEPAAGLPAVPPVPPLPGEKVAVQEQPPEGLVTRLTFKLTNVPLTGALKMVGELGNFQVRWDDEVVVLIERAKEEKPGKIPARPALDAKLDQPDQAPVWEPLQNVRIPKADFRGATPREAWEYLQQRAKAMEGERGMINSVLRLDGNAAQREIYFYARNLPLLEMLRYVAEAADLKIAVQNHTLYITPKE